MTPSSPTAAVETGGRASQGRRERRSTYIDFYVQGALLRRFTLHWTVFYVVMLVLWMLLHVLTAEPNASLFERMRSELGMMIFMAVVMLALLPAFMLDTIRLSHRFAGPMRRLRGALKELAQEGRARMLQFRDEDFWQDAADEFNAVRARFQLQQDELEALRRELAEKNNPVAAP